MSTEVTPYRLRKIKEAVAAGNRYATAVGSEARKQAYEDYLEAYREAHSDEPPPYRFANGNGYWMNVQTLREVSSHFDRPAKVRALFSALSSLAHDSKSDSFEVAYADFNSLCGVNDRQAADCLARLRNLGVLELHRSDKHGRKGATVKCLWRLTPNA